MELEFDKFPFRRGAQEVLKGLNITFEKIDSTNTYDDILNDAYNDILDSVTKTKPVLAPQEDLPLEVAKFFISLMIVKPFPVLEKFYTKHYLQKLKYWMELDISKARNALDYYFVVFDDLGFKWQLVQVDDKTRFMRIGVHDYMEFAILVEQTDPPEYKMLELVNATLSKGWVYFYEKDYNDFQMMINLIVRKRIRKLIRNLEETATSDKIENVRIEINKYLKDKSQLQYIKSIESKVYEISPADMVHNQENLELFKQDKLIEDFPPCVNACVQKIKAKQNLSHNENILLGTYLVKKGWSFEQILEVYKQTPNYKEKISKYNINYLIRKQLTTSNCHSLDKTQGVCKKEYDTTGQCGQLIKNPLSYRGVKK